MQIICIWRNGFGLHIKNLNFIKVKVRDIHHQYVWDHFSGSVHLQFVINNYDNKILLQLQINSSSSSVCV